MVREFLGFVTGAWFVICFQAYLAGGWRRVGEVVGLLDFDPSDSATNIRENQ